MGGNILSTAIKATKPGGAVTCCGNAAADSFESSVYPFILRGVSLHGIDSATCPAKLRKKIWELIATDWRLEFDEKYLTEVTLNTVSERIDLMMSGKVSGRTLVVLQR